MHSVKPTDATQQQAPEQEQKMAALSYVSEAWAEARLDAMLEPIPLGEDPTTADVPADGLDHFELLLAEVVLLMARWAADWQPPA